MNQIEVRERRAAAWAECQEFNARYAAGEKLTDADHKRWTAKLNEVDTLGREINMGGVETDNGATFGGSTDRRDTSPEASAFRSYLRTGEEAQIRAQGTSTGSGGGYTVPDSFRAQVVETMKKHGGIRRLAEIITTTNGQDLPYPTNDDTGNIGHILGENTVDDEQDVAFGGKTLGAHMYTSKLVKASFQLLEDNAINIDSWLASRLGTRIARAQAAHFATGSGANQPQGLVTGLTVGKTTASASAITYDELVDLVGSVDPAYLEGSDEGAQVGTPAEGVAWLMNSTTYTALRKIRDDSGGAGLGRPIIEPDVQKGMPRTLLGYPVVIDNAFASITNASKPIAFGNIRSAYVIRDVVDVRVLRLVERYADALQVGFLGFHRSDGMVQDASAAKVLQMLA